MKFKIFTLILCLVSLSAVASAETSYNNLVGKWDYQKSQTIFPSSMKIPTTDTKVFYNWVLEIQDQNKCKETSQLTKDSKIEVAEGTCDLKNGDITRSYNQNINMKVVKLTETDLVISVSTKSINTKMYFKKSQ